MLDDVEVISLDAGGTLFSPSPSVGHIYEKIAISRKIKPPSAESMNLKFKEYWQKTAGFDFSKKAWKEVVDYCFLQTCPEGVDQDLFDNIYLAFENIENWKLYSDVELALDLFQQNGKMIVISSNWDERLKSLISGFGLEHHLSGIFVSHEIGFTKPSPQFFNSILDRIKCAPSQILHIGDDYEKDYLGAKKAGFKSLLLNRSEIKTGDPTEPKDIIHSLIDTLNFSSLPTISLDDVPESAKDVEFYHVEEPDKET